MECCRHIWACARNYFADILDMNAVLLLLHLLHLLNLWLVVEM